MSNKHKKIELGNTTQHFIILSFSKRKSLVLVARSKAPGGDAMVVAKDDHHRSSHPWILFSLVWMILTTLRKRPLI